VRSLQSNGHEVITSAQIFAANDIDKILILSNETALGVRGDLKCLKSQRNTFQTTSKEFRDIILRGVQLYLKPNPQPLPYVRVASRREGRGLRFKASLRLPNGRLTPTGRGLERGFKNKSHIA
jgi:hypothetical protein